MVKDLITVGLGGALGAMARYLAGQLAQRLLGASFPWGTLAVNISGCFLIGLACGLIQTAEASTPRLFIIVGVLGGFTTFSAFGYETIDLLKENGAGPAAANVGLQIAAGLSAVWLGQTLSRAL
jgi:CrcB protein